VLARVRRATRASIRTKPPVIALFGLFGSGNTGNDGSLEAMLATLGRLCPDADILCICGEPATTARDYKTRATALYGASHRNPVVRKLANLARPFRELRHCRLLIVPGTGALDDFGTGWSGLPLALFAWCLAARLRGAVIAFVSVGAGPIVHPFSRWLMKRAVGMAAYRSYRDRVSKEFLEGIGLPAAKDPIYPDLAFLLPTPANFDRSDTSRASISVGLGVMTYWGWRNDPTEGNACYRKYLGKIARFALWLLDRGHSVRLLMGDNTDRQAVDDLQRLIAERRPTLQRGSLSAVSCCTLHELMAEIGQTDIVVATRFHNVVCALKLGRPVISIGYSAKNEALLAEVGLAHFSQAIEELDVDLLIRQFSSAIAELDELRRRLASVQSDYLALLRDQEVRLAACLRMT
jgi:polysaccharide pyruvyl transferase WcaK-like protein